MCVLQCARRTVQDMASVTKPPNAASAPASGWKTSFWQILATGRATVVMWLPCTVSTHRCV